MDVRLVDPARSRIVLVGTPAYDDPALPDVPVVANNVADLAALFTDARHGGFDAAHCVTAPDRAGIGQIGDLLVKAAAEAEDLLLLYYSGHGLLGRRRELFLSVAETWRDRLAFTALPFDAVRDAFLDSRASCRVVILDSCFSGQAIGETLADAEETVLGQVHVAGTYTLTSAPANRTALILPGEKHTAFTERLLDLLLTGTAMAGPMLSLGDIYRHLHGRLLAEGLPVPQQRGTGTADLLGLVRNRHSPSTSAVGTSPSSRLDSDAAAQARLVQRETDAQRISEEGDKAAARWLYRQIVIDRERLNGLEAPETLRARRFLAYYVMCTDPAEAKELFGELIPTLTRVLGEDSLDTLVARRYQAYNMAARGKRSKALRLLEELIIDMTRVLGSDHKQTLLARGSAAYNIGEAGRIVEAVRLYRELVVDMTRVFGAHHVMTLAASRELAYYDWANGEEMEATRMFQALLPISVRRAGRQPPAHRPAA